MNRTKRTSFRLTLACGHAIYRPQRTAAEGILCGYCGTPSRPVQIEVLGGAAEQGEPCRRGHAGRWQVNARGKTVCLDCAVLATRRWRTRRRAAHA